MRMRMASVAAAVLTVVTLTGCGDDGGSGADGPPPQPPPTATIIELGTVALTATNQSQTFDVVVDGTSSLVIVADGGDATDIDIERLRTPSGIELVTANRQDANPLTGGVSPQERGQSVATAIVPGTSAAPLELGTYTFSVASFDAAGTRVPATVRLTAIVNHRNVARNGLLPVRVFFVGSPGLTAGNAATSAPFFTVRNELAATFGRVGIAIDVVDTVDVDGDAGTRLAVLDVLDGTTDRIVPDGNLNRQSDEMDELFTLSRGRDDRVVNVFFVREFVTDADTVAVSGAAPGPSIISGTAHSGIVVSTRGGLDQQSASDLRRIGHDLAREVARYLGALGTVDPDDFTGEQQASLLRNPAVTRPTPAPPD